MIPLFLLNLEQASNFLTGVIVRSDTRIRLIFSKTLAVGAFNVSLYSIASLTPIGASPNIKQVLVIPGVNTQVELVLSFPLVTGCAYSVTVTSIPATDGSTTPLGTVPGNTEPFTYGAPILQINVEPKVDDLDLLMFGQDLFWNGTDFLEDASGDLSDIAGPLNAKVAIERRLLSDGLPWDDTYGAKPSQYVDGTAPAAQNLRGALEKQALSDDRVQSAKATLSFNSSDVTSAYFETVVKLVGLENTTTIKTPIE